MLLAQTVDAAEAQAGLAAAGSSVR
jgi:hypothetical protein